MQQPGAGVAGEHVALDPDDGGDMGMPVGIDQFVGRIEHGDGAAFVAVAALASPYIRGHILRFGQYALDMDNLPDPLNPQPLPFEPVL